MEKMKENSTLKKRIRSGCVRREDVTRRLEELAFGSANDCVRLALAPDDTLEIQGQYYLLHRVEKRRLVDEEVYQWALCVEKGSEEPWTEPESTG